MNKYNVKTVDKKTIEVDGKLVKNSRSPRHQFDFKSLKKEITRDLIDLKSEWTDLKIE